ncbi:gamma-glutamyl-gamma-aminobutyrate hydrolase family protein [Candidatus Gracilibacteria bacterium]|nr:gamma-glutamyl-gamma-aminobutyrate hydrolase family protein [Candidatus Gracilibacteria bacterium]
MTTKIGIFAQYKESEGRCLNSLPFHYVQAVESTGTIALIIPSGTTQLAYFLDICDGFVFPGGADIDPSLYHQDYLGAYDCILDGDLWLASAMRGVMDTGKPILGICKGMQLLNVAHGGDLIQDIVGSDIHNQAHRRYECVDMARIVSGGFVDTVFGDDIGINSIHHQAIGTLGDGLRVAATSQHDSEIEAIEHIHLPYYGTQWHPECIDTHRPLFQWFVTQCS